MKLPKNFLFWEILPFWICAVCIVLVAIINPEYLGIMFRPSTLPLLGWSTLGFIGVGLGLLTFAGMILSGLRAIWPDPKEAVHTSFIQTWIACPLVAILAIAVTLAGTFVILLEPASITMVKQMEAIKNNPNR